MNAIVEVIEKSYHGRAGMKIAPTLKVQCAGCARVYRTTQWPHIVAKLVSCIQCNKPTFGRTK